MKKKESNLRLWWIRTKKITITAMFIFLIPGSVIAQSMMTRVHDPNKLVLDDQVQLLNEESEKLLGKRLRADSIELTSVVDFKQRCTYYYTELSSQGEDVLLSLTDCNQLLLGSKNLGSRVLTSSEQEVSMLLAFAILDIVSDPGKHMTAVEILSSEKDVQSAEDVNREGTINDEHKTRYFFAPSAFNLKKGVLYYNTVYFLLHDIQYGVEDWFSIGMGTTVIGLPFYVTPKISIPVGEKSAFAIGDMLLFGTYGTNAIGNLAYTSFSTGGPSGNVSFGVGHLATNESDIAKKTSSLVLNFSAMTKVSPYIYLLTENYLFNMNLNRYAYRESYDPETGYYDYLHEEYPQKNSLWYGIAGFRITSKKKDFLSWQVGLTYVLTMPGEIPGKYASWNTYSPTDPRMIAFPTISYSRKFSKRY